MVTTLRKHSMQPLIISGRFFLVYRVNKDLKVKGTGMYAQTSSINTSKQYLLKYQSWESRSFG